MAGNIVTVRVVVNSSDQAINSAEGVVSFPVDFLKVVSLDTGNSLFPFWIQAPSFSNGQGTITFNGGLPSPGFTGTGGTIVAITFQAKKSGTATISVGNASVLANDGLGTDVLQGTNTATLTIENLPAPSPVTTVKTTNPKPASSPAVDSANPVVEATSTPILPVSPPTIESYTHSLVAGQQFVLSGIVDAETNDVLLFEQKDTSEINQYTIQPNAQGYFTFVSPSWSAGRYQIWLVALSGTSSRSTDSTHIALDIAPSVFTQIGPFTITSLFIAIAVGVLILIQLIIALWSVYRLRSFQRSLENGVIKSEKDMHKGFSLLKDDLEQHLKQLGQTRSGSARTLEAEKFKTDVEGDIADLERFAQQDLETLLPPSRKK
jgi:hypothetical protein